jgi:hypothetical protein
MAEWLKAPVLKTGVGASSPGVRIPLPPNYFLRKFRDSKLSSLCFAMNHKIFQKILFGIWMLLVLGGLPLGAVEPVEYVPARSYFDVAQREILQAKKSVTVCLYLFSLRSTAAEREVFQLAQSLVKAHNAGVHVEVFLDNNVSGEPGEARGFNGPAFAFLCIPRKLTHVSTAN